MSLYVNSETNFDDPEDHEVDVKEIKWFTVKANVYDTEQEIKEKKIAMREQYAAGIIQHNGLPQGISKEMLGLPPEPVKSVPARRPPVMPHGRMVGAMERFLKTEKRR